MKQASLFILFIMLLFSCGKQNFDGTLDGTWRMVLVKDNTTGATITKPTSIQGNVEITFTTVNSTTGTFFGKTPSNEIWQNDYQTGPNRSITILSLSMTKVGETSWGNEFVDNIRDSQEYSFDAGGRLTIKTMAKSLVFQKL